MAQHTADYGITNYHRLQEVILMEWDKKMHLKELT